MLKFGNLSYPTDFICFIIRDDRIQKLMKVGALIAKQLAYIFSGLEKFVVMKVYQIGLIFALVFGLAVVTTAKTMPQSLQTKPSQQVPQVPFSEEELLNASPYDPAVQKKTLYAVAKIMYIKRLDPELALPAVIVNTTIPVEKIAEYVGFDIGSNLIHYFSYLKKLF